MKKDIRIGDIMRSTRQRVPGTKQRPSFALVGSPVDEGVMRNGGRPGSAEAPAAIRRHLFKMTPPPDIHDAFIGLVSSATDLGDVARGPMEAMQQRLGDMVAPYLEAEVPVIILGGGHETSYGHHLGYRKAGIRHQIINLDAHADVRPLLSGKGHSGSPFRQVLEDPASGCTGYIAAGLQPHSAAGEHVDFIWQQGGSVHYYDEVNKTLIERLYKDRRMKIMATFDMDALDQSVAPGVSAPNPNGLDKSLWLKAFRMAGENYSVTSMDLVEVNPVFDRDEHTSRLAALSVWSFLVGLSLR